MCQEMAPRPLNAERGLFAVLVGAFRSPLALALLGAPPFSVKSILSHISSSLKRLKDTIRRNFRRAYLLNASISNHVDF
jgi:hypothetical protein